MAAARFSFSVSTLSLADATTLPDGWLWAIKILVEAVFKATLG